MLDASYRLINANSAEEPVWGDSVSHCCFSCYFTKDGCKCAGKTRYKMPTAIHTAIIGKRVHGRKNKERRWSRRVNCLNISDTCSSVKFY